MEEPRDYLALFTRLLDLPLETLEELLDNLKCSNAILALCFIFCQTLRLWEVSLTYLGKGQIAHQERKKEEIV